MIRQGTVSLPVDIELATYHVATFMSCQGYIECGIGDVPSEIQTFR
jgi:hypothetical protein